MCFQDVCVSSGCSGPPAVRPSLAGWAGTALQWQYAGPSSCRAQALGALASMVVVGGFSFCSTGAELSPGMWDLPGPGIEPMSPALAGGFFTTEPPGKPSQAFYTLRLLRSHVIVSILPEDSLNPILQMGKPRCAEFSHAP